jgi:hypothetical protein
VKARPPKKLRRWRWQRCIGVSEYRGGPWKIGKFLAQMGAAAGRYGTAKIGKRQLCELPVELGDFIARREKILRREKAGCTTQQHHIVAL